MDVEFFITDEIKADSILNLKIVNNSAVSYILPIITSQDQERWKFILSAGENKLFFIHLTAFNESGDLKSWTYDNCFEEHTNDSELTELDNRWKKQMQNLKLTDLILLKPKRTTNLRIPFHPDVKITSTCSVHIKNNMQENSYIQLSYYGEDKLYPVKILPEIEKVTEEAGYELYKKKIFSNKVLIKDLQF